MSLIGALGLSLLALGAALWLAHYLAPVMADSARTRALLNQHRKSMGDDRSSPSVEPLNEVERLRRGGAL